ncbi:MAG: hypothetical protein J5740_04575 [Bacteroidales bacterium]|nr:hypothetical protein [Bacteroidales bacterium]
MAESFADLGRVQAIRQLFEGTGYEPFGEPLWLTAGQQECIVNASGLMLEGIDFDLVYFPLPHLGRKSVLKVTGELYAVMAQPESLTVQLGVSAKLDFPQVQELWSGIVSAAKEHGYKSLSLDLQPSKNGLTIALAATGRHSASVTAARPKARSKDLICVSGPLGAAYLGLQALQREKGNFEKGGPNHEALERYKMLVAAYLKPELGPVDLKASYGYFVTRGLADALLRLQRDSGFGVKVYADKIPFEGGSFDLGKELNLDPVSAAMNGGEDYHLLYVVPLAQFDQFRKDFQTFDIIGHLSQPEVGAVLVTPEGVELPLKAQGW